MTWTREDEIAENDGRIWLNKKRDPATTCAHCSGDMTQNTRCSHDGICVIEQKTELETKISELESWAEGLELSATDLSTPFWMRQQDLERAEKVWAEIERLKGIAQMTRAGLVKCASRGCPTLVAGSRYCPKCEEGLLNEPYPLRNVLKETFPGWVMGRLKRLMPMG